MIQSNFIPDVVDTLFVWSCLNQAKEGINPYGKDIAEVYVKHLLPQKFEVEDEKDAWKLAGKNLHTVIKNFCNLNCVRANVNGIEAGDWLDDFELRHKCDVRIYKEVIKPKGKRNKKCGKK